MSHEHQASTTPGDGTGSAGRKAHILIVEDEPWDAELAQRLLTSAGLGFTAAVVDTREPFVQQLAEFRPDVILSDYHLPGFSGEEALKIAQHVPGRPFLSGPACSETRQRSRSSSGSTDYVLKDRRPAALVICRAIAEPSSGRGW